MHENYNENFKASSRTNGPIKPSKLSTISRLKTQAKLLEYFLIEENGEENLIPLNNIQGVLTSFLEMELVTSKLSSIKNYNNELLMIRHLMRKGNKLIDIAISDSYFNGIYKEEIPDFKISLLTMQRAASLKRSLSKKESGSPKQPSGLLE